MVCERHSTVKTTSTLSTAWLCKANLMPRCLDKGATLATLCRGCVHGRLLARARPCVRERKRTCVRACLPACLPACLSVCPSVCPSVCLSVCSVTITVTVSVSVSVCLSVCLRLSLFVSVRLSGYLVYLPVSGSVSVSVCVCVCVPFELLGTQLEDISAALPSLRKGSSSGNIALKAAQAACLHPVASKLLVPASGCNSRKLALWRNDFVQYNSQDASMNTLSECARKCVQKHGKSNKVH